MTELFFWIILAVLVVAFIAFDLFIFGRKETDTSNLKSAWLWSAIWITIGLLFGLAIYYGMGLTKSMEYLTGYVLEKSLSIDNLFVFLILFKYFNLNIKQQHRVLFWGILGALVMRYIFIYVGLELLKHLHWMNYVFGIILLFTAIKLFIHKDVQPSTDKNIIIRIFKKIFPISDKLHGSHFVIHINNKMYFTTLFIALIMVETTDVIFAIDSIPAIMAITQDTFIVFSSNTMAIIGLRALFFAIAGSLDLFRFLHYGLASVLLFIGIKMIISLHYTIPLMLSLSVVLGSILITIVLSLIFKGKQS